MKRKSAKGGLDPNKRLKQEELSLKIQLNNALVEFLKVIPSLRRSQTEEINQRTKLLIEAINSDLDPEIVANLFKLFTELLRLQCRVALRNLFDSLIIKKHILDSFEKSSVEEQINILENFCKLDTHWKFSSRATIQIITELLNVCSQEKKTAIMAKLSNNSPLKSNDFKFFKNLNDPYINVDVLLAQISKEDNSKVEKLLRSDTQITYQNYTELYNYNGSPVYFKSNKTNYIPTNFLSKYSLPDIKYVLSEMFGDDNEPTQNVIQQSNSNN